MEYLLMTNLIAYKTVRYFTMLDKYIFKICENVND